SKAIHDDQLDALARASARNGASNGHLDLALLTDGLRAEREQGITIDVAYRYFATATRRFTIADTPGHAQYTRNMVTGASNADVAVILVDARKGLSEQSRRHAVLSALLGVRHLTLVVNKMDLVAFDKGAFDTIAGEFRAFAARLAVDDVVCIPTSALEGDNVVERSDRAPWYEGPTVLGHLEALPVDHDLSTVGARLPVQWVVRPDAGFRGYAGTLVGGPLRVGDAVVVLPAGLPTRVTSIGASSGPVEVAGAGAAVTVTVADDIDISRGDLLCGADDPPAVTASIDAVVCWMAGAPLAPGRRYHLKHTTRWCRAVVEAVEYRLDVVSAGRVPAPAELGLNEIGGVTLATSVPLALDRYRRNRVTGSFILVDDANATVGAGLVGGFPGG
ncbi:MAG: sulfate adenylyltransferase subunit 1, partial [Acidimicrobiales bacterium]